LFHQMRARNAATLDEVVGLAKGVARSFGGEITEEQQTIAQAYLDPRTLNRYPAEQAASIRQLIDQLTPEQKAALDACRDKITRGSEQLTEVGATKEGLSDIIKKNYGQYISRTYKIFGREGPDYLKALRTPGTEEYSTRYLAAIRSLAADGDADQSKLFVDRLLDTIQRKGELPRREIDQTRQHGGSPAGLEYHVEPDVARRLDSQPVRRGDRPDSERRAHCHQAAGTP